MNESRGPRSGAAGTGVVTGLAYGIGAYLLWGLFPVYFLWLAPVGPYEIIGWRIALSLVFCAIVIGIVRAWPTFFALLRQPRIAWTLLLAAILIAVNWTVFIAATMAGEVVETSLGYFMNPILTILLGVVFLRERLRPLQWAAVAVALVAVVVLTVAHGSFPWIGVVLALSFGLYSLVKKQVGGRVDPLSGLGIETLVLTPAAIAVLVLVAVRTPVLDPTGDGLVTGTQGWLHTLLVMLAGVVTAVPLLMFAAAARRVPLSYLGLTQFLTPIMTFITGVFFLHEDMPPERWIGFGIVWLAVILLVIDTVVAMVHGRRALRPAAIE